MEVLRGRVGEKVPLRPCRVFTFPLERRTEIFASEAHVRAPLEKDELDICPAGYDDLLSPVLA